MPVLLVYPLMCNPSSGRNTRRNQRRWKGNTGASTAVLQLHVAVGEEITLFKDDEPRAAGTVVWPAVAGVDVNVGSLLAVEAGVG